MAWTLKPLIAAIVNSEPPAMAYRFVDLAPFMPTWGQRVMVPGCPVMHRVVTGRLQRRNNDLAIAFIHPLQPDQMNFDDIRETGTISKCADADAISVYLALSLLVICRIGTF